VVELKKLSSMHPSTYGKGDLGKSPPRVLDSAMPTLRSLVCHAGSQGRGKHQCVEEATRGDIHLLA
jgi:hypothetical protein